MGTGPVALTEIRTLADGLDHPEGVAWDPDGWIYAGGEAGQLYRVDPATGAFEQVATTGGFLLGLALDGAGNVYACDLKRSEVVRIDPGSGTVGLVSNGTGDVPMRTPNYPAFDDRGRLLVSDSGGWETDDGLIYVVDGDGATTVWSNGARRFPNGLAVSPDGSWLYVVESLLPGVSRIEIAADGSAGQYEVVLELPGTVPDGIAFTRDGRAVVACYQPNQLLLMDAEGRSLETLARDDRMVTLAAPTNVAFIGNDQDDLVIASLARWHVGVMRSPLRGLPLRYPTPPIERFSPAGGSEP